MCLQSIMLLLWSSALLQPLCLKVVVVLFKNDLNWDCVVGKVSELSTFSLTVSCLTSNFQIHWGSMVCRLKICLKFIVHQFRQSCDTLKIIVKFIMHQLISLVPRLLPVFLVEEPGTQKARLYRCMWEGWALGYEVEKVFRLRVAEFLGGVIGLAVIFPPSKATGLASASSPSHPPQTASSTPCNKETWNQ